MSIIREGWSHFRRGALTNQQTAIVWCLLYNPLIRNVVKGFSIASTLSGNRSRRCQRPSAIRTWQNALLNAFIINVVWSFASDAIWTQLFRSISRCNHTFGFKMCSFEWDARQLMWLMVIRLEALLASAVNSKVSITFFFREVF